MRLDRGKLADLLARAPVEGTDEAKRTELVIELPSPDGGFTRVRIEEVSILGTGQRLQCPGVKIYRGRGVDERRVGASFSWSPLGFHALVASRRGHVLIWPYSPGDTENYMVCGARECSPPAAEPREAAPAAAQDAPGRPPIVSGSPAQPSESVQEVTIQRACFGCEYASKLTLRGGGTATLTMGGTMHHGTVDHTCTGSVAPADFARVAALIQREGFFDLKEAYRDDPETADGKWTQTSVVVDGRKMTVLNSNEAGPANLKRIEDAIDALGNMVAWTEAQPR